MTTIGKYARLTVIVLVVGLFTGCFGGGSSTTPMYSLMVKVLDDATGTPIAGAVVKVVGKDISETFYVK